MRLIPKSRRGRIVLALGLVLVLAGGAGGLVARWRHDPWPARTIIDPGASVVLQGFAADGRSLLFRAVGQHQAWDVATGRPRPAGATSIVVPWAFARDGRSFAGQVDRSAVDWADVASGAIRARFPVAGVVLFLRFAADDRSIRAFVLDVKAGKTDLVTWDLATGDKSRLALAWWPNWARPLACTPAGDLLIFGDPTEGLVAWDVATGRPLDRRLGSPGFARDVNFAPVFTPDGRTLVIAGKDGRVEAWDVAAGRLDRAIALPFRGMTPLAMTLSSDGRTLAASAATPPSGPPWSWVEVLVRRLNPAWARPIRTELVLVDLATGRTLARSRGSSYAEFSPDGRTVVTAESDGTYAVRDAPTPPAR